MKTQQVVQPRFRLGRLTATPGAIRAMQRAGQDPLALIERHRRGDWGVVGEDDAGANERAVAHEGDPDRQERVLSVYVTDVGDRLWVITEADRSATCVLLPEDY